MKQLSIEELKELRELCNDSTVWAAILDELTAIREAQGVPVAYIADCGTIISNSEPFFDAYKNPQPLFTAPQKPVVHPDTKRLDWLCAHCVEVRDPQMYGSHAMFHAQQDSEEWDLPHHTTLREQVDAAIASAGGIVKESE
ncbi:hypothetical protein [Rahnella sp. ChDrAdgB13]|uniref:hypothetical protein n=1 Tax=Rahnella sp. ChDrAdgB13 TaxID=1850581 RepID=UPI001AD86002|nr:hypothetical protein [Rahnella sp. ChDrAdgB13]